MHYFIKNTRNLVAISLLSLVILAALGYFSFSLNAQSIIDPKALAEKDAKGYAAKQAEELFLPIDSIDAIYGKGKQGCGMKSSMFFVLSSNYSSGNSINDVVDNKMFEPLVKSVYAKIKKYGFEEATLNNMREYQDCIAKAKPNKDPSREYDLSLKHDACVKLNGAILETLDAIKQRKSVDYIFDKYAKEEVDFSYTMYKDFPNPIMMFIGNIYNKSKNSDYKNIVVMGSAISVACYA